jgi:hypothetical protein
VKALFARLKEFIPTINQVTYTTAGLSILIFGIILLIFILVRNAQHPSISPALQVERTDGNRPLPPFPEPAANPDKIGLGNSVLPPIKVLTPVPVQAKPDPLIAEHSKKLGDIDTLIGSIMGDMAAINSRLEVFQTESESIKKQLAQHQATSRGIQDSRRAKQVLTQKRRYRGHSQARLRNASNPNGTLDPALQIVAVNNWGSEQRIVIRQNNSNRYSHLKVGDPMSNGTIVSIDGRKVTLKNAAGQAVVNLTQGKL